jgi:hypothetical protein
LSTALKGQTKRRVIHTESRNAPEFRIHAEKMFAKHDLNSIQSSVSVNALAQQNTGLVYDNRRKDRQVWKEEPLPPRFFLSWLHWRFRSGSKCRQNSDKMQKKSQM